MPLGSGLADGRVFAGDHGPESRRFRQQLRGKRALLQGSSHEPTLDLGFALLSTAIGTATRCYRNVLQFAACFSSGEMRSGFVKIYCS